MKLERHMTIAGQPVRKIRDLLRCAQGCEFAAEAVVSRIGANITEELVAEGLIEPVEETPASRKRQRAQGWGVLYRATDAGARLANARLIARMNRGRANRIVEEFLYRVDAVNADEELLMGVIEVRAFGSFITDAADLGDIDLAVRYERREIPGHNWCARSVARADATGRRLSFIERLCYGETEVRRLLRARNPYLSLHGIEELERLGCESRPLYPRAGHANKT